MKNNTMLNKLAKLIPFRIVPTYRVTYAPSDSRNPFLPIQSYEIAGNPKHLAWKSKAGNTLFTAFMPRSGQYASFRADRTLSVNFTGWTILAAAKFAAYGKTLA